MVKDQRRDAQRLIERASAARPRRRAIGGVIIGAVALSVIVVPHFISSSPTTNDDTDPGNGVTHLIRLP